jgi:glycosyltransferase involved in cell wall biosynthesis
MVVLVDFSNRIHYDSRRFGHWVGLINSIKHSIRLRSSWGNLDSLDYHVVMISTSFPDLNYQPGGDLAGAFSADFASQLAKHANVTVIAPSGRNIVEKMGDVTIRRFAVPSLPLSLLKPYNPGHWPKIIATLKAGQNALRQVVEETPVNHIFALWALPSGYWARSVMRSKGIQYSIWSLGSDVWVLGKVPVVKGILRRVLLDAGARFADGFVLKQDIENICGKECLFLPSSRKLPDTGPKQQAEQPPYKLAFLGRWHPHKGVDLFLDSLSVLSEEDWSKIKEIRVCGGGPLEDAVKIAVNELKKAGRPVALEGYLNRQEAADLYHWADYLVLPSRIESIPVIFSDCMQGRLPLISTPIGDLPRLMEEYKVGVLAEDVTAPALAQAISRALSGSPAAFSGGLDKALEQFDVTAAARDFFQ